MIPAALLDRSTIDCIVATIQPFCCGRIRTSRTRPSLSPPLSSHRLIRLGLEWGVVFISAAVLWKVPFLLESCVGRLNSQDDFDGKDLAWCAASIADRIFLPGPPVIAHYLSLAVLALLAIGLWRGALAAWGYWRTSWMREWVAGRSSRVVFVLRYGLILVVCIVVDWLVPAVQPCASDFLYSPASGFRCQLFQDKLPPVPLSPVPLGTPLPIAALFIVIVWYAYEARFASRS